MKMNTISGATIAAAAAAMMIAGAGLTASTPAFAKAGHCMGANACKGQGFAMMSKGKCSKAGGTFEKA